MNKPTDVEVRTAFNNLRPPALALARSWRLRRAGRDLSRALAALETAVMATPIHDELAISIAEELVVYLTDRSPSNLVTPALEAARALLACWMPEAVPGQYYDVVIDENGTTLTPITAEEAAEMAVLAQTTPPGSHDCAICRMLERRRQAA